MREIIFKYKWQIVLVSLIWILYFGYYYLDSKKATIFCHGTFCYIQHERKQIYVFNRRNIQNIEERNGILNIILNTGELHILPIILSTNNFQFLKENLLTNKDIKILGRYYSK